MQYKTLKTERLILRGWQPEDADDLYEYAGNPVVGPMAGWAPHEDEQKSLEILKSYMESGDIWAIALRENGKVIGQLRMYPDEDRGRYAAKYLSYALSADYWGHGYMTEAVKAVIKYAFEELEIDLLTAFHSPDNLRTKRVIEKCGFEYEITFEKAYTRYDGEVSDNVCYRLMRDDYLKNRTELEAESEFLRYRKITADYYSKWLGQDGILNQDVQGAGYVYSEERNTVQYGYGEAFDLYVLCREGQIVVSYGKKAADRLDALKEAVGTRKAPEEIKKELEHIFNRQAGHGIKYVFRGGAEISSEAKVLVPEDYTYYEEFFVKCHPGCRNTEWLREYYDGLLKEHMCVGVFDDRNLVSCTDGPGMPYMEDAVQEIGINTLPEYRGRGYAAAACSKCISGILSAGKIPVWSTSVDNTASRRLAERIGFEEFAESITITL